MHATHAVLGELLGFLDNVIDDTRHSSLFFNMFYADYFFKRFVIIS